MIGLEAFGVLGRDTWERWSFTPTILENGEDEGFAS